MTASSTINAQDWIKNNTVDYILWVADDTLTNITDPARKYNGVKELAQVIAMVPESGLRVFYVEQICKKFKVKKGILEEEIEKEREFAIEESPLEGFSLPKHVDAAEFEKYGFYEEENRYKFVTKYGVFDGSNFIIKPLFHIYSKSDNKRLVELVNFAGYSRIVDIPSKSFVSFEQFQQVAYQEGNYIFFGNKPQFFKILNKISDQFPVCQELKTLGWQREGFYAFSNGIYDGAEWKAVNNFGMTEHKGHKFFSPAFSDIYKNVREDDDEYENDRYFIYLKSKVNFEQWCRLMVDVYQDNGKVAIAFLIASLFRDLIYEKYKIFPHLFLFGQKGTGKSQLGWSLQNVFMNNLPAFNLNHGTNVGFFRRLARFRNAICWFDEYSNAIRPERHQALKSAYDGVGHEKGKMTKDARTEITKVNTACVISGQYLPTLDDNALFSRSILLDFFEREYTEEELKQYNELKNLEENGLSSILIDLLVHRNMVAKKFPDIFSIFFEEIKKAMELGGILVNDRLIRNFATILAPFKILSQSFDFGFTWEEIYKICVKLCMKLTRQISLSDSLATFWNMIQFLIDKHEVLKDHDFKVENIISEERWPVMKDRSGAVVGCIYGLPTKLLFLRLSKIHPLYLEAHRKQYGVNGVDLTSISHYLSNHKAFIGVTKSTRFENCNTSAYVFMYESLNLDFERIPDISLNEG